jgi:hypothetical protein
MISAIVLGVGESDCFVPQRVAGSGLQLRETGKPVMEADSFLFHSPTPFPYPIAIKCVPYALINAQGTHRKKSR